MYRRTVINVLAVIFLVVSYDFNVSFYDYDFIIFKVNDAVLSSCTSNMKVSLT